MEFPLEVGVKRVNDAHVKILILINVIVREAEAQQRFPSRRATVMNNATTEIPPDTKNRPQKGSGPNLGSSTKLLGEEEQSEDDSSSFSSLWTSPFSLTLRIASEMSKANDEPFGNTC